MFCEWTKSIYSVNIFWAKKVVSQNKANVSEKNLRSRFHSPLKHWHYKKAKNPCLKNQPPQNSMTYFNITEQHIGEKWWNCDYSVGQKNYSKETEAGIEVPNFLEIPLSS